ncbi:hypothetical protein AB672_09340 [Xylella taiwanensis]|nr:hypothetical protein AB672_09340 [Xylella taiwanensis]
MYSMAHPCIPAFEVSQDTKTLNGGIHLSYHHTLSRLGHACEDEDIASHISRRTTALDCSNVSIQDAHHT